LNSFDVDKIELETLLFQTGYLTIASIKKVGARKVYELIFPNLEVRMSLTDYILYIKNDMDKYEGYYASIFYCCFAALGLDVKPEEPTNTGRIDLTVKLENNIYLIQFKVLSSDKEKGKALKQIKTKKYYQKYLSHNHSDFTIFLIGVEFGVKARNIINVEWEKLESHTPLKV